jgi:hypothetical protein
MRVQILHDPEPCRARTDHVDNQILWREQAEIGNQCLAETSATLTSPADRADLMIAGVGLEQFAANVAESYANGQLLPFLPFGVEPPAGSTSIYERTSG